MVEIKYTTLLSSLLAQEEMENKVRALRRGVWKLEITFPKKLSKRFKEVNGWLTYEEI